MQRQALGNRQIKGKLLVADPVSEGFGKRARQQGHRR